MMPLRDGVVPLAWQPLRHDVYVAYAHPALEVPALGRAGTFSCDPCGVWTFCSSAELAQLREEHPAGQIFVYRLTVARFP